VRNPLFLLDEIDKLGMDFRGDPASALLEVLDPEQNHTFQDHYVEVDFDLSDVMFVATSNTLNIPPALLDRMEVIRLSGYTEDEKIHIAHDHLLPKVMKNNGVKPEELKVDESAMRDIVRYYTREAGVRSLERDVGKICRKVVKKLLAESEANKAAKSNAVIPQVIVTSENLSDYLGVRRYNFGMAEKENQIGQVTGLAWTEVGGDLLTIEVADMPGKGVIQRTGSIGDVMKESVEAARSVVRARAARLGIADSIVSALTHIPVRADVAMTGEITLRGEVLAIGGLKEKLLAAHRGGIKTVLIPEENVKDLAEIPDNVKNHLEIVPVRWIDKVLEVALSSPTKPLPEEAPVAQDVVAKPTGTATDPVIKH
jgi:ATP-dependent Lon protease